MKYKIELMKWNDEEKSIIIKGWVQDEFDRPVEVQIERNSDIITSSIKRVYRPDLFKTAQKSELAKDGFIIKVKVRSTSGIVKLKFLSSDKVKSKVIKLKKFSLINGESKLYLIKRLYEKYKPFLLTDNRDILLNKSRKLFSNRTDPLYQNWIEKYENKETRQEIQKNLDSFAYKPLISIIVPVYNVEPIWLHKMIESVEKQYYTNWELCITDDNSTNPKLLDSLKMYAKKNSKIKIHFSSRNEHISKASNKAIELADGEFIGLLDNDDELSPDALYEVVKVLNASPETDFIYSDEDKINENGVRNFPYFKTEYAPETLLSNNYICHFSVLRKSIVISTGGFREGVEGAQDHDLFLRVTEKSKNIKHISKILYHWRMLSSSTAAAGSAKNYANLAGIYVVQEALNRRKIKGVVQQGKLAGVYSINYQFKKFPKVSIVITMADHSDACLACIESLIEKTTYPNYEIIIVDAEKERKSEILSLFNQINDQRICFIDTGGQSGIASQRNQAVKKASGEYVIFITNQCFVITGNWIEKLVGLASQDSIGAVGCITYNSDLTIKQGGVIYSNGELGFINSGRPAGFNGYFRELVRVSNCSIVATTGAIINKDILNMIGGFNESLNDEDLDIDLSSQLMANGFRNAVDPSVRLFDLGADFKEKKKAVKKIPSKLMNKYGLKAFKTDPMFNINLSNMFKNYKIY